MHYSSIPYFPANSALYIREADAEQFKTVHGLTDLMQQNFKIGVIDNFVYSKEYYELFDDQQFKNKLVIANDEVQCFKLLLAGRVDGVLLEHYSFKKLLHTMKPKINLVRHSDLGLNSQESGSYIIYSKASVNYQQAARLNKALESLKAEGVLDRIIESFVVDQQTSQPLDVH